ncbi:MAG: histidinol-phosphate transaminase [Deltaproteobacteria bacterium]|nr:histidinol-phosphate transaminase [Deltaproteobacteria bacterium]MBW2323891.1 histidinol-phosphate transaminase [Deltaproteobacteria bacterium]
MFEYLITEDIASLEPYPPGKPIEEVERELGITGVIKMASNENPLGPSPRALEAMTAALPQLNRYPDASGFQLKQALAEHLGLDMANIILGNGSDEIIELSVHAFLRPGQKVIISDPTFLYYSKVVQVASGRLMQVPLKNFQHDLTGIGKAVDEDTRLIFLDNPNNPSGSLTPANELKSFIADLPRTTVLALDEAYRDFARNAELIEPGELINGDQPVVFLRTFSKAYGLAGLRIGYGIGHAELIDYLDRVRQPFNINSLAQIGAIAALEDKEFYEKTRNVTWSGLDYVWSELDRLGLRYRRCQTNYFLIELDKPITEVVDYFLKKGIIVRSMEGYGLKRTIRLTIGSPEENERFIKTLQGILDL